MTVQPFRYQVITSSRWPLAVGAGNTIDVLSVLHDGQMTADADGHYTGSGSVVWVAGIVIEGCANDDSIRHR